jgi:hypothetical protein
MGSSTSWTSHGESNESLLWDVQFEPFVSTASGHNRGSSYCRWLLSAVCLLAACLFVPAARAAAETEVTMDETRLVELIDPFLREQGFVRLGFSWYRCPTLRLYWN